MYSKQNTGKLCISPAPGASLRPCTLVWTAHVYFENDQPARCWSCHILYPADLKNHVLCLFEPYTVDVADYIHYRLVGLGLMPSHDCKPPGL